MKKKVKAENNSIAATKNPETIDEKALFNRACEIIETRKQRAGSFANREVTFMYWEIGQYVGSVLLAGERAEYGKKTLVTLSQQLMDKYGKVFELRNLRRMIQFADVFPDIKIVSTLSTQLNWSHFIEILPLKTEEARLYYANDAVQRHLGIRDFWTVLPPKEEFERKIKEIFYEARERLERRKLLPGGGIRNQIDYFFESKDDEFEDN